jgi:NADPH-dependent ferric siderophore reductase
VADPSAVPAAFAMAEGVAAGRTAAAVVVADDGAAGGVAPASLEVTRVVEDGVADALGSVDLPPGTVAYVYGERSLVRQAVDALAARGLGADAIASKAYWRRDQANAAHGEPAREAG